jgi:hypothetical protein
LSISNEKNQIDKSFYLAAAALGLWGQPKNAGVRVSTGKKGHGKK